MRRDSRMIRQISVYILKAVLCLLYGIVIVFCCPICLLERKLSRLEDHHQSTSRPAEKQLAG